MPSYGSTAKYALRKLLGTSLVRDVDAGFAALADDLDALIATASQGTLASRPTSTSGSPGKSGRLYYATDEGVLYYDYGTGWLEVIVGVPVAARLRHAGSTPAIADQTFTQLPWDTEDEDAGTVTEQHASGDNTKLTCRRSGLYQVNATVQWAAYGPLTDLSFKKNTATQAAGRSTVQTSSGAPYQSISALLRLTAGDYVTVQVWHNRGSGLGCTPHSYDWARIGA